MKIPGICQGAVGRTALKLRDNWIARLNVITDGQVDEMKATDMDETIVKIKEMSTYKVPRRLLRID